jgi:tRNA threonylcarbamoyladenosine biosynthesis protein TsaE
MEFLSKNIEDTKSIAIKFVSDLKFNQVGATVFGLCGELGSGKTTFMKSVALAFGVAETIQSPTFVIMKKYDIRGMSDEIRKEIDFLIHIDAYRMESGQEILNLGWHEIISNPKNIIFIEWPDKIKDVMPDHSKIFFEHVGENERKIIFE